MVIIYNLSSSMNYFFLLIKFHSDWLCSTRPMRIENLNYAFITGAVCLCQSAPNDAYSAQQTRSMLGCLMRRITIDNNTDISQRKYLATARYIYHTCTCERIPASAFFNFIVEHHQYFLKFLAVWWKLLSISSAGIPNRENILTAKCRK